MGRLLVTGSRARYWPEPDLVKRGLVSRIGTFPLDTVVMQGGADGVDAWTFTACEITGHDCVTYLPALAVPSPQRYHERNDRMLDEATYVLAFWDGTSRGTASVIRKAQKRGLPLWVVRPENLELHRDPGARGETE